MSQNKSKPSVRGEPLRQGVLDAAEQLLREGKAEFSMRDLAAAASVSFATPFNQFGSKAALMHALSERRIDAMEARFAAARPQGGAGERVLLATDIAATVMLEAPIVNRAIMGWLGSPGRSPGLILTHSTMLWTQALGAGDGLIASRRDKALLDLPRQLAFAFRGALSFWTAGELPDAELGPCAARTARTLLASFVEPPAS